jgi:hypothetical protein
MELVYTIIERRIDTEFFSLKRTFSSPFCPWRALLYPESWHNSANWSKQTFSDFAFRLDVMLWNWDFRNLRYVTIPTLWLKFFVTIVKSELPSTWTSPGITFFKILPNQVFHGKNLRDLRFWGTNRKGGPRQTVFSKIFQKIAPLCTKLQNF